jgi:hypothetical protein
MRLEINWPKYGKHRILYLVHHVKIINIHNYESYEIRQQSESVMVGKVAGLWPASVMVIPR